MIRKSKPTPNTVATVAKESAARADAHAQTESTLESEMTVLRMQMKRNQVLQRAEQAKLAVLNEAIENGELL